jgi:hypothetical protein
MSSLVELIFFAEKTHPNLPLYDPQTKELVAAQKAASAARIEDATPGTNEDAPGDPEDTGGPNWEEMIVRAITTLDAGRGVQPKYIFEWISTYVASISSSIIEPRYSYPTQKFPSP